MACLKDYLLFVYFESSVSYFPLLLPTASIERDSKKYFPVHLLNATSNLWTLVCPHLFSRLKNPGHSLYRNCVNFDAFFVLSCTFSNYIVFFLR